MKQANDNIIVPYKGRKINKNKPVRLYRNLTRKGVWYSLVQDGKTVAHTSAICLKNCTFNVSEKIRQWVIKNQHKAFHAYVEGYVTGSLCGTTAKRNDLPAVIKYNPYINKGFTCSNLTSKPFIVKGAGGVICNEDGVRASYLIK